MRCLVNPFNLTHFYGILLKKNRRLNYLRFFLVKECAILPCIKSSLLSLNLPEWVSTDFNHVS